jgi:uncharacterized protein YhbP (UPF0306 family)
MSDSEVALDVPTHVVEYLQQHHTFTLATASPSGVPRAATYLYVNDGPTIYFWSRPTTLTSRQIQQNPVVAFTVDDYSQAISQTQGVQGTGECSVLLSGEQIARVADLFGQKFPDLAPGSTMSISFFRVVPSEIQFIDNSSSSGESIAPSGRGGTFGADFRRDRAYSVITSIPLQPVERFVEPLQPISVSAGEPIVRQGTPADKFLIIVEGEAEVIEESDGQSTTVSTLVAGDLFGEGRIMRDQPRAATVRATTDVKLLALEREAFRDLVAGALGIAPDFDEILRSRLQPRGL